MPIPARFEFDVRRCLSRAIFPGLVLVLAPCLAVAAEVRTGEQVYRQRCASCHGTSGQGTDDNYPRPLVGNRSVDQLKRYIAKKMPKDDPVKCTGEDAQKVAAYIHDAFYSPEAQARARRPRIELSHLTVRQYRNSVADLVGTFGTPSSLTGEGTAVGVKGSRWDDQRGLRGEYFKSRRFRNGDRILERLDPEVRFDFGTSGPVPEKFDPQEFSIRWQGGLLAPETGEYELIVRTEHAVRLWVNDLSHPLIDAWVKSGSDTDYRATIYLLGGRVYPLRLEFSKAKQGVQDSKEQKAKRPAAKASIALEWKPPGQVAVVIPRRCLSPNVFPATFVATAPFPPDDRSIGYERGTSVSKSWDQATTEAAIEVADYLASHLRDLAGVRDDASDRGPRLRAFCGRFAERALRRPLTAEQKQFFIDRQFERARDLETAVKRVVLLVLKSPRFLYPEIDRGTDPYDVASRLSFGLWDSLPDQELLQAAAAGRLATPEQVARQAERMLADLRARSKVREFLHQWLKIDPAPDLSKARGQFPGFDQAAASDLRASLDLFLDDVAWSESSDFRQIFLADYLYLNGRLARFYGVDLPPDSPFQKVPLEPRTRAGILSHPYLMAAFAYTSTSSPIHRGVFLARNVLGLSLRPPPQAFAPLAAELHPELSTRERVALQTRPQQCQSCHAVINPLGFTLENFDAIGRYRAEEKGRKIDASGAYLTRTGQLVKFAGVRDLATFLAGSEESQEAFVEQLFHYLIKQPIRAYGPQEPGRLREFFAAHACSIRKLMVEIMAMSAQGSRPGAGGTDKKG